MAGRRCEHKQRERQQQRRPPPKHGRPAPPSRMVLLHISIPSILLNKNPATSDSTKNSQIQFHSQPRKLMVRGGYATAMDRMTPPGSAGSPETNTRSQYGACNRSGDTHRSAGETKTFLETASLPLATLSSYAPSFSATSLHTTSLSAGMCTAGAVLVIPAGS